jgi:hypothetical protein
MLKEINLSITKKLIWLTVLTVGTLFVTLRTNQNETVQSNQPALNRQVQTDSLAPPTIADIPPDYRSSYKFVEPPTNNKKH